MAGNGVVSYHSALAPLSNTTKKKNFHRYKENDLFEVAIILQVFKMFVRWY
jgi:hypothetical protein